MFTLSVAAKLEISLQQVLEVFDVPALGPSESTVETGGPCDGSRIMQHGVRIST